jgi:hypothetical protein
MHLDDQRTATFAYLLGEDATAAFASNGPYRELFSKAATELMDETVKRRTMPILLSAAYVG